MNRIKAYRNPKTGEELTAKEWGERLDVAPGSFNARVRRWGLGDERTFMKLPSDSPFSSSRRRINVHAPKYTNPATGETLTAEEWGDRLNISGRGFRLRVQELGLSSPDVFKVNHSRRYSVGRFHA